MKMNGQRRMRRKRWDSSDGVNSMKQTAKIRVQQCLCGA